MGGGGGGDGGYAARQQQIEDSKAQARAAVNRLFGVSSGIEEPIYGAPAMQSQRVDYTDDEGQPQWYTINSTGRSQIGTKLLPDTEAEANLAGRDSAYGRVRDSIFDYHKQRIDDDAEVAVRKLKFALLRSGNAGGGLDIDQNALLGRTYDKGVLEATNQADAASNQARASDDAARLDLLSRIDAGMDQTSAIQGAANQLRASGEAAIANARGQALGNVFDNAGLLYQAQQIGTGKDDAARQWYERQLRGKVPGSVGGGWQGETGRTY
ncbi:MAG: hypothetical protein IT531_00065 [Burkholderiales bacterium]|nr:hypothetical protein [Burkholderiales bacterium]